MPGMAPQQKGGIPCLSDPGPALVGLRTSPVISPPMDSLSVRLLLAVAMAGLALPARAVAQVDGPLQGVVTLTARDIGIDRGEEAKHVGGRLLFFLARYHAGDDLAWADPAFYDGDWEIASPGLRSDILPRQGWPGVGWFRIRLIVDESLRDRDIGFAFTHAGALEAWLDGRMVYRSGSVGSAPDTETPYLDRDPVTLPVEPGREYLLALRYSNFVSGGFRSDWTFAGPGLYWGDRTTMMRHRAFARFNQGAFSAFFLAFALLFGLLYGLYRSERLFLYLAVSQGLTVPYVLIGGQIPFLHAPGLVMPLADLSFTFAVLALLAELMVVYAFFHPARPRQFYLVALAGIAAALAIMLRLDHVVYFLAFVVVVSLEMLRVVILALWRRRRWAWIVAVGVVPGIVIEFWDLFEKTGLLSAPWTDTPFSPALISMVFFSCAFSAYVGVRFAEAHRGLVELEAARRLQLSMLPEKVPEHPLVELAASMQTATEVGGDYYDFDLEADGTLTIVVGDATGHGTKAGVLVTATKSLWSAFSSDSDLEQVVHRSSDAIRRMGLPKLYMALALARLRGHTLELVGAGLPPALVHRAATGEVEEVPLKGMPLGGPGQVPYRKQVVELLPGDAVLFMTDGFLERFSRGGEMLGYDRVAPEFAAVASSTPEGIIAHLMARCDEWGAGRAPDDDVTFVALRVKGVPASPA